MPDTRIYIDPEMDRIEKELAESLGTRVSIERRQVGGKLVIDFFSNEDLRALLDKVHLAEQLKSLRTMRAHGAIDTDETPKQIQLIEDTTPIALSATNDAPKELLEQEVPQITEESVAMTNSAHLSPDATVYNIDQDAILHAPYDDRAEEDKEEESKDLYSVTGFSI